MKKNQSSSQTTWLNTTELHQLQVLAEQLNTATASSEKHQTQQAGQLNSQALGSGSDYAESRPYQIGDDPRSINWRLSARSQETFVKTYYADSRPSLTILLDQRTSMIFGTRKRLKISQALRVALLLSHASEMHGLDFKAWVVKDYSYRFFDNTVDFLYRANQIESTQGKSSKQKVAELDINAVLKEIIPQLGVGSLFYLISDLAGVQKQLLSVLSEHGVVQVIHILDPAEISLKDVGALSLEDRQASGVKIDTQNESQRLNLSNKIHAIQARRKKTITELNISYTRVMTKTDNIQTQIYLPIKSTV